MSLSYSKKCADVFWSGSVRLLSFYVYKKFISSSRIDLGSDKIASFSVVSVVMCFFL